MKKRVLTLILTLALAFALAVPALAEANSISEPSWLMGNYFVDGNGGLWKTGWDSQNDTFTKEKFMDGVASVGSEPTFGSPRAAIKTDGSLWTWGSNRTGALGDGTTNDRYNEAVKVMEDVVAVSCGEFHTAAIKTDGTLWTWGYNATGQLGNGSRSQSLLPVKVLDNVAAVSCGRSHTAAIRTDGTLWMWGDNHYGQLGNGGRGNWKWESSTHVTGYGYFQTVPVKVMEDVAAVTCGSIYTAAIKTDGTLWMWGSNSSGELGNGGGGNAKFKTGVSYQTVPVKVLDKVAAVSCVGYSVAAIRTDGALWMWGYNYFGQLGNGSKSDSSVPALVMYDVSAVARLGSKSVAAIKTDGSVWIWGYNSNGEGDGSGKSSYFPQKSAYFPTMPLCVRFVLNGGRGTTLTWLKKGQTTLNVPENPTREGYTFAGWYTDEELTKPYNFNDRVTKGFTLFAKWVPVSSTAETAGQNGNIITVNNKKVTLDAYTLKADNGGDVTYVKLRDLAALLDGTGSQFNVDWRNGSAYLETGKPYTTRNGAELKAINSDGKYHWNTAPVLVDGVAKPLEGFMLRDERGGHTFFKLRDLSEALGFTVGWSRDRGIYIETN